MSYFSWRPYVSVAERRAKAKKSMEKLKKKGTKVQPIELTGRKIAASFWGKGWCDHLESFSDYENRLPRGRTYVRNGSVCHLEIHAGQVKAIVSGSELYNVTIEITPLPDKKWNDIKKQCQGHIGSVLELLQGRLSNHVMSVVTDRAEGLFPKAKEIKLKCSCPDWATMCKHVAAVLYGVGNRLDHEPGLLFVLRGVDASELISADVTLPTGTAPNEDTLAEDALADIFGIDIATEETPEHKPKQTSKARPVLIKTAKARAPHATGQAAMLAKAKAARKKTSGKQPKQVFDPAAPTGKGIACLRALAGLTKSEFARKLGVSPPTVQRWEDAKGILYLRARPLAALIKMQEETGKE